MTFFAEKAPAYWAAGLPAIPLRQGEKRPFTNGWQRFCKEMPTPQEMMDWVSSSSEYNMGLALGPCSKVIALDVDYADESDMLAIKSVIPESPCTRIGSKGFVKFYKYRPELDKKFQIKRDGKVLVELLTDGQQVVLPPSIHPDTHKPYQSDTNLYEVVNSLPSLPANIDEVLSRALCGTIEGSTKKEKTNVVEWVPAGARDTKLTSMAGIYAQSVLRGNCSLKEALSQLETWAENFTEKVVGDPIDIKRGKANLVTFLFREVNGEKKRVLPIGWDDGLTQEEKVRLGFDPNESTVQMTEEQIIEGLRESFEEYGSTSPERSAAINKSLKQIISSKLDTLSETRVLSFISKSEKVMSLGVLRKALSEYRNEGLAGMNHTEIAEAVLRDLSNELDPNSKISAGGKQYPNIRYARSKFWTWNGAWWKELQDHEILSRISREYGYLPAAKKASDHKGIREVMRSLVSENSDEFIIADGLNMANGFVDEDLKLIPQVRKQNCTYCLNYRYLPEMADLSNAPRFAKFLKSVWGHNTDYNEKVHVLGEAIGATLMGLAPRLQRCFLLFGAAGSGKSQIIDIIKALLPKEQISYVSPYKFSDKFAKTMLSESRLNVCGELSEKMSIQGNDFKEIVDGSMVDGQYKNMPIFYFEPKAAHWFASNHLPKTQDVTEGFYRRWVILTFDKPVKEEDKELDIGKKIVEAEKEQIVAWALSFVPELLKRHSYSLPASHNRAVREMMGENDSVYGYMTSKHAPNRKEGNTLLISELYEKYRSYCYESCGEKAVGMRNFYKRLRELSLQLHFDMDEETIHDYGFGGN